jgi:hypothetical protein
MSGLEKPSTPKVIHHLEEFYTRNKRRLAWYDREFGKKGEFGPANYDETTLAYGWRVFKRGFSWGFILTTAVMSQYIVAMYLIRGAALT